MILQHYMELLRSYRRWVLAIVAACTVLAALVSAVRLSVAPVYTAAASVAVIPTEAEYTFGRDSGTGPRSTARALTATYIEYLKSRPVVEAAFETIGEKAFSGAARSDPGGWIGGLAKGTLGWARRTYRRLDSGQYVAASNREAALQQMMDAITMETVADSYILRVQVDLPDPRMAAAAANALAQAYVERVSQQLATSVGQIGDFLQQQIAVRETEMNALTARQEQLKTGVGTSSLDAERTRLLMTRETERQKVVDAQAELQSAEAELSVLGSQNIAQSGRTIAELNLARSSALARRDAARNNLDLRRRTLVQVEGTLEALRAKEEPLVAAERQLDVVKQELTELHSRRLATDLSRSSALTQVRVIDPAVVPVYPSSPHVVQNTILGFLAGLLGSLMLVVLADTLSSKLKTTTDLERLAGPRGLGALPADLVRLDELGRAKSVDRLRRRLLLLGERIETGLTMVGAFDAPAIQVTGFVFAPEVAASAVVLAASLACRGKRVVCLLPDGAHRPSWVGEVIGQSLAFTDGGPDDPPRQAIRIESLGPVSADLSLAKAAARSPALVCVVPALRVPERDVRDFEDAAQRSGLSGVAFVLLEA